MVLNNIVMFYIHRHMIYIWNITSNIQKCIKFEFIYSHNNKGFYYYYLKNEINTNNKYLFINIENET